MGLALNTCEVNPQRRDLYCRARYYDPTEARFLGEVCYADYGLRSYHRF